MAKLQLVGDPAADALLDDNPMALLIGMLLDHQRSMLIRGNKSKRLHSSGSSTNGLQLNPRIRYWALGSAGYVEPR